MARRQRPARCSAPGGLIAIRPASFTMTRSRARWRSPCTQLASRGSRRDARCCSSSSVGCNGQSRLYAQAAAILRWLAGAFQTPKAEIGEVAPAPLFGLSVLVVLRKERPEIVDFLLVLEAGEDHLGGGNLGLRILDVFLELALIPGDAGILVGVGVGITLGRARFAAIQSVEFRADLVPGAFADRMAGQAF